MEKAKQAAREFLSGDGKHKTTVSQETRNAVTNEHVRPEKHEHVTAAVDREVHQEHHQTRIQPVKATETLPEQHTHNVLPTEHKTIHHGDDQDTRRTLEREAAQFKNTSTTHGTTHSTTANPTVTGERIHHHVHEHIQPVIEKDTIQPHVVHTTAPVHETHHAAPIYHETTTLPTKTIDEFSRGGGREGLGARAEHTLREYEGCPKPAHEVAGAQQAIHGEGGMRSGGYSENVGLTGRHGTTGGGYGENMAGNNYGHEGGMGGSTRHSHTGAGLGAAGAAAGAAGMAGAAGHHKHRSGLGRSNSSSSSSSDEGRSSRKKGTTGAAGGLGGSQAQHKPSLKDKLDPRKDADGDGKAGLFS